MAFSQKQMREIAREYEDQWKGEDHYRSVDNLVFKFECYNLERLNKNNPHSWTDFLLEVELKNWESQFGFEDAHERLNFFKNIYPKKESIQKQDPVVIIETEDGKGHVWDGNHRVAGIFANGNILVWAVVGRQKHE